ncbi:MAG: response regulator transcription factor [Gammaproteobacteria bacterium]|nr:response regulator transcription factor [Gammaproteobacteria bacterium]
MKVLLVDDEPLARERLRRLLAELPDCAVCGEAADGRAALELCGHLQPDVVLMDIRMPGMDGLEAARHLAGLPDPPAVIFTTAFGDHALEAFETCAVDYLLKPIRGERLAAALGNARRLTRVQAAQLDSASGGVRSHICVRVRGNLHLVPVTDIRFFRADHKYVTVRTGDAEYLIEEPLKALEDEFGARFLRIHRNALVAADFVAGLEKDAEGQCLVVLGGIDERLEVSRRHQPEVRARLKA